MGFWLIGLGGDSVGQHRLVSQFMKGARCLIPVAKSPVPSWDLVLDTLSRAPFEPLDRISLQHLTLKTALMVLVSAKRIGDLHQLSVHEECMQFSEGATKVVLQPRPGYIPKNPLTPGTL